MEYRQPYHYRRRDVSAAVIKFAAQYFGLPARAVTEDAALITLAGGDWHRVIGFSFAVEEHFGFEFPEGETGKDDRVKSCRADTIKTIGEYVVYITRYAMIKKVKGVKVCTTRAARRIAAQRTVVARRR